MKTGKSEYNKYNELITELVSFSRRPGMYVGVAEMDLIIAFLSGKELSTKFKLRFGNDLTEYVFNKYSDNQALKELEQNPNYYTLKEQMNELSIETNKTAVQVFRKEAIEFLMYISDEIFDGLYRNTLVSQLKLQLESNINSKDEIFTKSFRSAPEDYILRYLEEWKGKIIPHNQMELLREIGEENSRRSNEWITQKEGQLDDKSRIRELSIKLLNILTKGDGDK